MAAEQFIKVSFQLTYESSVPLSAYPGMSLEEAVRLEASRELGEVVELVSMALEADPAHPGAPTLRLDRHVAPQHVTPGSVFNSRATE